MSKEIENAMKVIGAAIDKDEDYAIGWVANLAMSFFDAMDDNCIDDHVKHVWCNEGARRFIRIAFDVDVKIED